MKVSGPILLSPAVNILPVLGHAVSPHINSQRKGVTLQLLLVLDAITLKQLLQTVINTGRLHTIKKRNFE